MIMIDWVTAKIPFFYSGIISNGEILSISRNGEIEQLIVKRLEVIGSFSGRLAIRTFEVDADRNTAVIELSGNPVKFLQGHNVFGSSDLLNLIYETILFLSKILNVIQPKSILDRISSGNYKISRVDINSTLMLASKQEVFSYLYSISKVARTRIQSAVTSGSTVYFNKNSKRWSVKLYSKSQEIELKRNKKDGAIALPDQLKAWLEPLLRVELTLKARELYLLNLNVAANWHTIDCMKLFAEYVGRIEMSEQRRTNDLFLKIKSRPAAASYQMWCDGHDLRQILPVPTFYRHRKVLLEYGVDISIPCPSEPIPASNVVPFCKVLELQPAVMPYWLKDSDLYFEPRSFCKPL